MAATIKQKIKITAKRKDKNSKSKVSSGIKTKSYIYGFKIISTYRYYKAKTNNYKY